MTPYDLRTQIRHCWDSIRCSQHLLRHLHRMTPEDRHRYRFTQAYQLGKLARCVVKADRLEDQLAGGEA